MRIRSTALIAFLALAATVVPAWAEEKAPAPVLVVRLKSIDGLIADARYLAEAAGKSEEAKQGEKFLRTFIGDNGFEGFDIKKPVALYGRLATKFEESDLVLMVPVVDEKPLLDALKRFDIKAEKGPEDIYKVDLPDLPFGKLGAVFFRFANGYAYITARNAKVLEKERLLAPAAVVPANWDAVFEMNVDLQQVPDQIKDLIISTASLRLGEAKEKKKQKPGETDAQHAFHGAALDELALQLKAVVQDGKALNVKLDLDRKNAEGVFTVRFTPKPGSQLATNIAELAEGKSIVANLSTTGSALTGRAFAALPQRLRKPFIAALTDGMKELMEKAPDDSARKVIDQVFNAVIPTIKAGELDTGFDLRGPAANGKYAVVAATAVKEGDEIEKAFRAVHAEVPPDIRQFITLDAEKAGAVNIHRFSPPAEVIDPEFKRIFGDGPAYIAVRKDAVLLAAGDKALDALKEVLAREAKAGKLLNVEASIARLAPLEKKEGVAAMAAKVFAKEPGADKVRITLDAGQALEFRASAKVKILELVVRLEEAKKKGEQ
jgi:hypothetical protein